MDGFWAMRIGVGDINSFDKGLKPKRVSPHPYTIITAKNPTGRWRDETRFARTTELYLVFRVYPAVQGLDLLIEAFADERFGAGSGKTDYCR